MSYVILDIDNCIADDAWRIPLIDWRAGDPFARYHAYHSASPRDAAGPLAESELVKEFGVIIFTGRPAFYRALTEEWLWRAAGITPHALLMRNDWDARPSVQVKAEQLCWLFDPNNAYGPRGPQDIALALDDREDIVEMYRAAGIRAQVSKLHDVCAYTNPLTGAVHD